MKKIFLICTAMVAILSLHAQTPDTVEICDTVVVVPTYEEVIFGYMDPIDLVTAPISAVYINSILHAEFPGEIETETEEGVELISCQEPGCDLRIAICPLGLEPWAYETLAIEFCNDVDLTSGRMIDLNGYDVKAYDAKMQMTEDVAYEGCLYVFTNGNTTIFLSAVSLDPEVDWWADHVTLNLPKENDLDRQDQLSHFVDFFNIAMEGDRSNFKIEAEDNGSELVLNITDDRMTDHRSYQRMSSTMHKLINSFTVFHSYADDGYLFTLKFQDSKGEGQSGYEFPYSEYSKWLYTPDLESREFESDLVDYPDVEVGG